MIVNELAYKVTIRADEFLNGKKKVSTEVAKLEGDLTKSSKNISQALKTNITDVTQFGKASVSAFRGVTTAAASFLGIGAGLYGMKQLFTSTANEIVRASQQAKFFGSDVNKVLGVRRGFQQAGLNGDAFISAAGGARMALANIKDPTIFGGLTGAAQNLMTIGARTGLNINQLGDPNKALSEFTRYGKSHTQENLMQVMSAVGFDPTDAAKIKSGELKQLVDSETKKSNITAKQVKEQENLLAKMGELSSQFSRIALGLAAAFTPAVIEGMQAFGKWIEDNQGNIVGFFSEAGDKVKSFTDAVGGAENALKILAGMYVGGKVLGAAGGGGGGGGMAAKIFGGLGIWEIGQYVQGKYDNVPDAERPVIFRQHMFDSDYVDPNTQTPRDPSGRTLADKNNNPGNIRGKTGLKGFAGYATEQEGWDAMSSQIMMYFNGTSKAAGNRRLKTVKDIISTWAPSSENDTASYIKQVANDMGVGASDELNLADPNVMAKLRTAMAKKEGFSNWQSGMKIGGANQFQDQYYLQQQRLANSRPNNMPSNVNNSQSSNTHIGTVVVNSNPQTADALTQSIKQQAQRSSTSASFSSAVR